MSTIRQFSFETTLLQVLLWQYNQSANLTALIQAKQDWYNANQDEFWSDWISNVFNLATANDFGCIVWAIILNFPLGPFIGDTTLYRSFGFNQYHSNFNNSNFAPSTGPGLGLTALQKTQILRLRYFKLTTKPNVLQTNKILAYLFGQGNLYIVDNLDMTSTVFYSSAILPNLLSVLENYDIIPRPDCVSYSFTAL